MGILSKGLILLPQLGHWEGGDMIDNFLGRRYIHTFEKLPIAAPTININIGRMVSMLLVIEILLVRYGVGQTLLFQLD